MSAPYIIPFNNQPVTTGAGTATYTVPSGKYARVTITLNTAIYFSASSATTVANFPPSGNTACDTVVISIWAKTGDAISFAANSPGATSSAGATAAVAYLTSTSTMTALLNGTAFAKASATATFITSNSASSTVTSEGAGSATYYYEEYNVIS